MLNLEKAEPEMTPENQQKSTHQLVYTQRRNFDLKNFNDEIYAARHMKNFLQNSEILFEKAADYISGENVLDTVLNKLIEKLIENGYKTEFAKKFGNEALSERKITRKTMFRVKSGIFCQTEADNNDHQTTNINPDAILIADYLQGFSRYDAAEVNNNNTNLIHSEGGQFCKDWIILMSSTKSLKHQYADRLSN